MDVDQSIVPAMPETQDGRTLRTSEEIDQLCAALAKAQGQCEEAVKDSANPFFSSTYANMASVLRVTRKPKADNGLGIVTLPGPRLKFRQAFITRITHSSGQWMEDTFSLELTPQKTKVGEDQHGNGQYDWRITSQCSGSAMTYARRYAEMAWMDLGTEDDDGHAASHPGESRQQQRPEAKSSGNRRQTKPPQRPPRQPFGSPQTSSLLDDLPSGEALKIEALCNADPAVKSLVDFISNLANSPPKETGEAARQIDGAMKSTESLEPAAKQALGNLVNWAKVRLMKTWLGTGALLTGEQIERLREKAATFDDGSKKSLLEAVEKAEKKQTAEVAADPQAKHF